MGVANKLVAYELSIVSMFRNEANYLKEWINYHRMVGVEHFWLYNNNSTDNWQEVLNPYIKEGIIEITYWPTSIPGACFVDNQVEAFRNGIKQARGKTKWLALIDIDEFLVPMHDHTIPECLENHFSDAYAVYVNWHNFGTGGVSTSAGEPILFKLTACSSIKHSDNSIGKSIVRPEYVNVEAIWYPHHFPLIANAYYLNGDGQIMPFRGLDLPTDGIHHGQYIRINHYVLRDESFYHNVRLVKAEQGFGNKNLLIEHYDSFSREYDYSIIDLIKSHYPTEYHQIWSKEFPR